MDSTSNRSALILTDQQYPQRHRQKRFLFEAAWTRQEKYQEIIQEAWKSQLGVHSPIELIGGLKECADNLTKWSQNDLGFY